LDAPRPAPHCCIRRASARAYASPRTHTLLSGCALPGHTALGQQREGGSTATQQRRSTCVCSVGRPREKRAGERGRTDAQTHARMDARMHGRTGARTHRRTDARRTARTRATHARLLAQRVARRWQAVHGLSTRAERHSTLTPLLLLLLAVVPCHAAASHPVARALARWGDASKGGNFLVFQRRPSVKTENRFSRWTKEFRRGKQYFTIKIKS